MSLKKSLMGLGMSAGLSNAIAGNGTQGLTATGSSSADALLINGHLTAFSTVASSTGAIFGTAQTAGDYAYVYNGGAQTLTVYPPSGSTIDNTTSASITTKKGAWFFWGTDTAIVSHKST